MTESLKPNKKLTPNQKIFADEWLKDRNGTRAYKIAYHNVIKDVSAANCATKLLRKTYVRSYIDAKLAKMSDKAGVTQEYVIRGFKKIVEWGLAGKNKDKAHRSLESLGKHLGLFEKDNIQRKPVIVLDAELIEKGSEGD